VRAQEHCYMAGTYALWQERSCTSWNTSVLIKKRSQLYFIYKRCMACRYVHTYIVHTVRITVILAGRKTGIKLEEKNADEKGR
jgi:hypothetical protein